MVSRRCEAKAIRDMHEVVFVAQWVPKLIHSIPGTFPPIAPPAQGSMRLKWAELVDNDGANVRNESLIMVQ
jgi:hypothetical protein